MEISQGRATNVHIDEHDAENARSRAVCCDKETIQRLAIHCRGVLSPSSHVVCQCGRAYGECNDSVPPPYVVFSQITLSS